MVNHVALRFLSRRPLRLGRATEIPFAAETIAQARREIRSERRRRPERRPARRIYFPVMMMYLDEAEAPKFYDEFALRLTEFMGAIRNPDILAECVSCSKHVLARQYYKALMGARKIVDYEDQRLGNVASSVQDGGDAG